VSLPDFDTTGIRVALQPAFRLADITWFRVGGPAELLFQPADEADLALFMARLPVEVPVTRVTVRSVISRVSQKSGGLSSTDRILALTEHRGLPTVIRVARTGRPRGGTMASEPSVDLPIEGKHPIFRHLDDPDLSWQKVRRQRNADGSEGTVLEKWLAFSPEPQYLSLLAIYSPGMIVRRHGHFSSHVVYIIEGGALFDDRWCPAGTHIELPYGAAFGPIIAGD